MKKMQFESKIVRSKPLKITELVLTLLIIILSLSSINAQESLNTTGGNALGNDGSVSYSVGQIACQIHTGTNGSVAEGVQQPFEILESTGIKDAKGIILCITTYPNPTTGYLTLEIEGEVTTQYTASLYDMNGKLLQSKKITGNQTSIVMSDFVPATYFLKVIQNMKEVKTFTIIKN